ncbi:hypothetical protein EDB89DRAFT_2006336 [Lactarius sanguifluus]|nr:hypothetical protein EDB89DRAFT_2006336 [Lactarius sanguifluus]
MARDWQACAAVFLLSSLVFGFGNDHHAPTRRRTTSTGADGRSKSEIFPTPIDNPVHVPDILGSHQGCHQHISELSRRTVASNNRWGSVDGDREEIRKHRNADGRTNADGDGDR